MKPLLFKRLGAYLFDFIVVTFIVSIITINFKSNSDVINKMNELLIGTANGEIVLEEHSDELFELNYEYQKSIIPSTIVSIVISIGYFIVFAYLNKGQTLGKKIFKIKVVNKDGNNPSIWNMLVRSIWLYGIFTGIINIIGVYVFNVKMFNYTSTIVNYIYYGFIIICFFMVMYKKDGRGIHDIIGKTYVKEKVR